MAELNFVITYPCFFLLGEQEAPELVEIDTTLCLCLFTDVDLVQTFYRDKHGMGYTHPQVVAVKSAEELLRTLKLWQPMFRDNGVLAVAFDVSPRRRPMYGPYADLIEMLEAERR